MASHFGRRGYKEESIEMVSRPSTKLYTTPRSTTPPPPPATPTPTTGHPKPPSVTASNHVSHLLRLPLELRISIFRYLIPRPERASFSIYPSRNVSPSAQLNIYYTRCSLCDHAQSPGLQRYGYRCPDHKCQSDPLHNTPKVPNSLAILRTSHQLHEEALSILYGENKFVFLSMSPNYLPVLDWVRKLSPAAKRQMRQIRVSLVPSVREEQVRAFEALMLEWLPGLVVLDSIGGMSREASLGL
ncbi:hypothetical protein FKW77_002436 [Venturia effusa]|uniref:DUF7730 domain-containing protein n=1 Tax=Venturia effusa TaxID=50376 RepID=A0A517L6U9_9PEZI|nr:hypothetical protein FKW77_002436 [Venturia effusa]